MTTRRRIVMGMAGAFCAVPASMATAQTEYPNKPIRLVVPYPPGGGTDAFARVVAERMQKELGQPIVVDNRPGAGTMIGADAVARSSPDGYNLLLGDSGTFAINRSLYKKLPYDVVKDFAPITLTARFALLLVTHPSLGVSTTQEFIAKARAQPGAISYASVGIGSPHHLAMEMFKQTTGADLLHVAYRGGAPAVSDLLPGRVPAMFLDVVSAAQHISAGKIKALAVASQARLPLFPQLPTLREAGLSDFEAFAWQGLVARSGTPEAIVQKLNKAYAIAAADPDVRRKFVDLGSEFTPSTPEEMSNYVRLESERWQRVIKAGNIAAD